MGRRIHRRALVAVCSLAVSFTLATPVPALATIRIWEGLGIGSARLGYHDSTCIRSLGIRVARSGRSTEYEGQTVYYAYLGTRLSNGSYPLEIYSNASRHVFIFVVNGTGFATGRGVRVGTTEAALRRAYGASLRRVPGSVYTKYVLGGRKGTDFYVRSGLVRQIMVRTY